MSIRPPSLANSVWLTPDRDSALAQSIVLRPVLQQQTRLATGIKKITIAGRISASAPRALGSLRLAPGARLEVPGRRVSIREWVTSGAQEIAVDSIELPGRGCQDLRASRVHCAATASPLAAGDSTDRARFCVRSASARAPRRRGAHSRVDARTRERRLPAGARGSTPALVRWRAPVARRLGARRALTGERRESVRIASFAAMIGSNDSLDNTRHRPHPKAGAPPR